MRIELGKHDNRAYVESRTDGALGVTLTFEAEACETFDDADIVRRLSPAEATQLARALTAVIVGGDRPFAPANGDEIEPERVRQWDHKIIAPRLELPNMTRPSWWQPARRRLYDECARNYAAAIAARPAPTRID